MPEKAIVTDIFTEPNDMILFVVYHSNIDSFVKVSLPIHKAIENGVIDISKLQSGGVELEYKKL